MNEKGFMMSENIIGIDQAEKFNNEILQADKPAAVAFLADWCPHCQRFKPTFESLADEFASKITFACVDIDQSPQLEADNEVDLIPTVLVYQGGQILHRFVNEQKPDVYRSAFKELCD